VALLLAPIGVWSTFVEPFRLTVEEPRIPIDARRAGSEPLRVAVLSDIQSCEVTDHLREAVRRAVEFEPHLILLPGDLMQCPDIAARERGIPEFRELLRPLDAPMGAWFVLGNTDWPETVERVLEGTPIRILRNETVELTHGDRRLVLAGISLRSRANGLTTELEAIADEDPLVLLLSHYPDEVLTLPSDTRVDLVVAGHTHGGQVRLPFFGPPITLSHVPRRVAGGGYHELDGRRIYVSRGLGCERASAPRVRFNCPPELTLMTLDG
jgi:predicted MPP superfamily phosphohydrolase